MMTKRHKYLAHLGAAALAVMAAGCVSNLQAVEHGPANLQPAGEKQLMVVAAQGVQIYECRAGEWAFIAPEAELLDSRGRQRGIHYAGPHWEAVDGSKVAASVKERADAPAAGAIPWLLLTAKSVGREGAFSKITSIQRVNTAGGVAPRSGCTSANAGSRVRVPYTADYVFFTKQS